MQFPVATVAALIAFILAGAVSATRLPVGLLPSIVLPVLTVRARLDGAAASEVSRLVAEPLEEAIAATPGLVDLESSSRDGEATLTLRFEWGSDMPGTTLAIRERLDAARTRLPSMTRRPVLLSNNVGERPIAILALGGAELRATATIAREVHARRLEQIDGVASVAIVGEPTSEIRVTLNEGRLRAFNLSADDVATAIRESNVSSFGGVVRRGQYQFSVRALTELRSLDELRNVTLKASGGFIAVGDVATVSDEIEPAKTSAMVDGVPAVGLVIYKDAGSNTVRVSSAMTSALNELGREYPLYKATVISQQATFVQNALANLEQEIIFGGLLSLLVIGVFLQNARGAAAIALTVPLSVFSGLVILKACGVGINIMSLGGLAVAVGLLVDNAIVVVESASQHRERGMATRQAAAAAVADVWQPLLAGTLTTIVVFGPVLFLSGLSGALFRELAISVTVTLCASLALSLTVLPILLAADKTPLRAHVPSRLRSVGVKVADAYETSMRWCLRHKGSVITIAIVVATMAALVLSVLPREVLPAVDEGSVVVTARLASGTTLDSTNSFARQLIKAARGLGSSGIYVRAGFASDEEVLGGSDRGGSNVAFAVIPVPEGRTGQWLSDNLRKSLPAFAKSSLTFDKAGQSEFGALVGREGRVLRVEVSATTLLGADMWSDSIMQIMRTLPELADVRLAGDERQSQIEVELDRDKLTRLGLNVQAVAGTLASAIGGIDANPFHEPDRSTPIRLRLGRPDSATLERALSVPFQGQRLENFVRIRFTQVPIEVRRISQRPVTVIEGTVAAAGTALASRSVTDALSKLRIPPGVVWKVAGANEERRREESEFIVAGLLSLAFVYLILAAEFSSFFIPLVVMTTVPLAGAGGLFVLWITGQSINAVSLIGMIVMIGLADNDAVIKLTAIRRLRAGGMSCDEAVLAGGRSRLRAIAMTSLTTVVGVLPLVLGIGRGGELYQPLAAGIIGGTISATLVTFFLLPTAYAIYEELVA
ncbi:MAG: efflux RND transporter permease subunit [Gemmatimonadota bacterium]